MTQQEQITFLIQLRKRFGSKRGSYENKAALVKYMADCDEAQKEIVVRYMSEYSDKMFTGGALK